MCGKRPHTKLRGVPDIFSRQLSAVGLARQEAVDSFASVGFVVIPVIIVKHCSSSTLPLMATGHAHLRTVKAVLGASVCPCTFYSAVNAYARYPAFLRLNKLR